MHTKNKSSLSIMKPHSTTRNRTLKKSQSKKSLHLEHQNFKNLSHYCHNIKRGVDMPASAFIAYHFRRP